MFKAKDKTLVIRGNVRGLDIQEPTNLVTQKQLRNVTIAEDVKVTVRRTVNSTRTSTVTGGGTQKPVIVTPPAVPVDKTKANVSTNEELVAAVAAVPQNGTATITLLKDITLTESLEIPEGKTVNLDLNGKSITGTVGRDADNNRVHTLVNNGTLTIKNGTLASKAENGGSAVANAAGATLILENVTLLGAPQGEHDDIAAANAAYPSYAINNWGELTVNTATIKTYHGAVATGAGGNVVLNDVTIDVGQNTTTNITSWALYAYGSADEIGKITINSGNVKMTKVEPSVNGGGYACTGDGGQITIKGGSFDKASSENNGNGIHVKANSLVITGGTFDTDPSAYVADGYKAVEADGVWTVSKRLAGEVINTEEAQAALDNATPGTVIQLSEGVGYGTLVFRQNASSVVVDITDAGGDAAGNEHYSRYEDITIIGAEGATVDQIDFEVGWIAGSGASYVDIENLTVQGVTFSGNKLAVNLEGSKGSALGIDGLTLVDCKMKDTDGTHRFVFQQITGYKALNDKTTSEYVMTAGVKNLTITGCEVEGAYQVIESRAMEDLTITDNIFKGIKARDMLITSDVTNHADVTYTGTITITGNASSGGEERFIRASLNNSNAGVVIKDNTITNYKGEHADYIKVTGAAVETTIKNNTITDGTDGNREFTVTVE